MSNEADAPVSPVLHVVVVGFHHKKGCQVEYSYPPLIQGNPVDSHDVPEEWKHIASLAIPDGAHNYTKDTIYFHLPSRDGQHRTVYGVACYRQIDSSDLVNRTADVTRSTVQKSVCVLSRLPLYGLVQAKLELITHAYFDEKDFSKVELLEDTYKNLSQSMTESLLTGSQIFLGMSCRDVVVQFRHKIVLLFKLILLERRVLFTGAPVQKLCNTILALLALFPGMIEFGLEECASVGLNKQLSPTLHQTVSDGSNEDFLEVCYQGEKQENKIADDKEYTGQDGQKEKLHQLLQVQTESHSVVSCEPESPEIQRGSEPQTPHPLEKITLLTEQQNHGHTKTQNHSETSDIKLTDDQNLGESDSQAKRVDAIYKNVKKDNCDIQVDTTSEKVQTESRKKRSKVHRTLSESYGDLDDVQHGRTSSQSSVHSSCSIGPRGISEPSSTEPLADMKTITQIESVQTGKVMTTIDSVVNIEEISDTMGILDSIDDLSDSEKDRSRFDRSLNLDDSTEVLKRSGSIEELDSPESILKIDQEDCFSWEEDRLLLKIDHKDDAESNTVKDKEGLGEVKEEIEGKDMVKPTLDLKLEISADDTKKDIISQPSEGDVDKNSLTNDSGISTASEVGPSENSSKESSPEKEITKSPGRRTAAIKNRLSSALSGLKSRRLGSKTPSSEQEVEMEVVLKGGQLKTDDCGFPLAIFTKGCVCHPYLSLQFFDLLQDINVRGFVIGATNMLFTQKKHLSDVIIEVSDQGRIEFHDRELQRQLNLTTADLRFADVLVKAVSDEDKDDIYLDGTEWEGGEEWLQVQFKAYLKSLLMTLTQNDTKLLEDFGTSFTQAFRTTHCYRHWSGEDHSGMTDVPTGHPFRGNLAVGDIRMRLQHNLQNTERGKKLNAAVVQTGKYVEQAGKAVGGAITNARSAVTSWFSSFSQKSDQNQTS